MGRALLLSALVSLALWQSLVIGPRVRYKLEPRTPDGLAELFASAPYRTARTSHEFYAQAARFSGATLYLPRTLRNHAVHPDSDRGSNRGRSSHSI